jgi:hypothetical protein
MCLKNHHSKGSTVPLKAVKTQSILVALSQQCKKVGQVKTRFPA